jgi:hypothetical protein
MSLSDDTAHALDSAARGTPIGEWARADKPVFTFTTWEEAVGRIFNILSAMRFQMIQIAAEVDDLRATIAAAKGETDGPSVLDKSGQ